jgi:hypothetical protein
MFTLIVQQSTNLSDAQSAITVTATLVPTNFFVCILSWSTSEKSHSGKKRFLCTHITLKQSESKTRQTYKQYIK